MLNVYVFPADRWGCGHYRMVWPAEVAGRETGVSVTIAPQGDLLEGWQIGGDLMIRCPDDADVLVFQRPTNVNVASAIEALAADGRVAVVVDMDDDLSCIDPRNPAYEAYSPRLSPFDNWQHAARACAAATWVTVSSEALAARYGRPGRVSVLPNFVPSRFLDVPRHDDAEITPTVCWPGNVSTHPADLRAVGASVARSGLPVKIIGPEASPSTLGVPSGRWSCTGPVTFTDWPEAISRADVGIAPLASSRFNKAKSWLKPLELAAAGVPVIMSDTPEYEAIHRLGVGAVAGNPREWSRALQDARSPGWRNTMSETGREVVAESLTIEGNGWRWADVWECAHKHRAGR